VLLAWLKGRHVDLKLYNTLTRCKEDFTPIDAHNVRMYVCGPTVYDYAHIGNARPVIVFDVLFRLLRHLYGEKHVTYVRNITDVDDKINDRAGRDYPTLPLNEAIKRVTQSTAEQFHKDVAALGCLPPTLEPRATEHIEEMKTIIERLVQGGFAYVADDHVLFAPSAMDKAGGSLPRYGALANRSLDEMIAGARVDVATYKKEPTDFVLWKPSKAGEPSWPSPSGIKTQGRPGWHIECSAMSWKHLGETFDIHGGGIDLVFPHHENEIAQSTCAFGHNVMANVWMHNGFLQVEGQKMSKSLGNFITIHQLLETDTFGGRKWSGEVLRLAMLKTHYRQPIDFTVRALDEAEKTLATWADYAARHKVTLSAGEPEPALLDALSDDLNTASAFAVLAEIARKAKSNFHDAQKLVYCAAFLGFNVKAWFSNDDLSKASAVVDPDLNAQVEQLIAARLDARRNKNWAESDRIRDQLVAMGIEIQDGKDASGNLVTQWAVKR
jgi:cysteinyl-tRNA synthetase